MKFFSDIWEIDEFSRCATAIDAIYFGERLDQKTQSSRHGIWDTISWWAGPDICELCLWESLVKRGKKDELWICGALLPLCHYLCRYYPLLYMPLFFWGKENLAWLLCILHRMFCMCHFRLWAEIFHCSEGEAQNLPVTLGRHGGIIDSWQVGDHRDDWK